MPAGLAPRSMSPLSGPRSVGGASNTSTGNFTQTVSSAFGAWRWQFTFPVSKDRKFRRYRGWVTALHAGANATRVPFGDPDMMTLLEAGLLASPSEERFGMPWSNGEPWSNGQNWRLTAPNVGLAASTALDGSIIRLKDEAWGHRLGMGDYLGFFPLHFGLYTVTEEFGNGEYRIWPPLRKALASTDYATLYPVMAMRLESEDGASAARGVGFADEATVTLVEVFDYDVRSYFTD
ncbi:putative icmD [Ensifer adhaerens OV14]|nr:putative icmD [Ensifer adhaerens OV14]